MQWVLIGTLAIHVLASVFWAGSTFALARTGAQMAERLFRPQMAAAAVTVLTGGYLWHLWHAGQFSRTEQILAIAAVCALIAVAIQGLIAGRSIKLLRTQEFDDAAQSRIVGAHRAAAVLLAITVVAMTAARYV